MNPPRNPSSVRPGFSLVEVTLAIGIVGSMLICTALYLVVAAAAIGAAPVASFADSPEPLALILREMGQGTAAQWIAVSAVVALPTVLLAFLFGQSRIFLGMARDGLLPRRLAKVSARGVPAVVTVFTAVVVAILAGLAYGDVAPLQWSSEAARKVDFFDVKADVQALLAPRRATFEPATHPAMHPGRCARVLIDGHAIGFVGELHPKWRQAYELPQAPVLFELALDAVLARDVPVAQSVARHQAVERDIALVVTESVTHAALMQAIEAAAPDRTVLIVAHRLSTVRDADRIVVGDVDAVVGEQQIKHVVALVARARDRLQHPGHPVWDGGRDPGGAGRRRRPHPRQPLHH